MSIQGKTIVFTGKISQPRHEFEKLVIDNGGHFGTSVTKNTDYLVVGDKPGSKLAVATLLGTKRLSEQEFLSLLRPDDTSEEPLTKEELAEIESHVTIRTCKWCGRTHKQFDTVPDYETCPVCEILADVRCPKCGSCPVFVTMSKNYYCYTCEIFFKAPHSDAAPYAEHIHILDDDLRCVVCRKALPRPEKAHRTQLLDNLLEQRAAQQRSEDTQREAAWVEKKRHEKWFESLTEEQINELWRQVCDTNLATETN